MHSIACCPTINITLAGNVKNFQSYSEGIYSYKGTINGRDYWVKVGGGDRALWYMGPDYKDWVIGRENSLGENRGYILSSSNLASTCPTNSKNEWEYYNDEWILTKDVQLNCIGNTYYSFYNLTTVKSEPYFFILRSIS